MKRKHPCTGCRYFFGGYEGIECCNYIFIVGHRRPCPGGDGCTEHTNKTAGGQFTAKKEPVGYTKVCPQCGTVFFTTYSNKVYCSRKCKDARKDQHKREKRKAQK